MKTNQAVQVRDADYGVDVTPGETPRLDTPPQPSSTSRTLRRVTASVLVLLLIAAIAAVVAWVVVTASVDQQTTEATPLLDQSIRARER